MPSAPGPSKHNNHLRQWLSAAGLLGIVLLMAGCGLFEPKPATTKEKALKPVNARRHPDFRDHAAYRNLQDAIQQSLVYLERLPPSRTFQFGQDTYDTGHMIRTLTTFSDFIESAPPPQALQRFIHQHFLVYQSVGGDRKRSLLFTGYYEPVIPGRREKADPFLYPVYAKPSDLITIDLSPFSDKFEGERIVGRYTGHTVVPYFERKAIDDDALMQKRAEVLAWVKDPVNLFFMHIQGSGKIHLPEGRAINLHYHATNGHPYRSIGRLLIAKEKIARENMSMQAIRAYLNAHPQELWPILHHNPSYVFFKLEPEGPIGYLQVPLTARRSIALDRRLFPLAALAYIETQQPLTDDDHRIVQWTDLTGFVLNQDTGGAIRGPGRADLFWGSGPFAETAAGYMQHPGRLYFLVLKPES